MPLAVNVTKTRQQGTAQMTAGPNSTRCLFVITHAGGGSQSIETTTSAVGGVATVNFTPTDPGPYTVEVRYVPENFPVMMGPTTAVVHS